MTYPWGKTLGGTGPRNAPVAAGSVLYNVTGGIATTLQEVAEQAARWNPAYGQLGFGRPRVGSAVFDYSGGATNGAVGTVTARIPDDTNYASRRPRCGLVTAAGAGSAAALNFYTLTGQPWIARTPGFQVSMGVSPAAVSGAMRWFSGLYKSSLLSLPEPSSLVNMLGLGVDAADTNVQLMYNDASGTATKVDMGASWPAKAAGAVYDLWVGAEPSTTGIISVRARRLDVPAVYYAQLTTNLPVLSQLLFPVHSVTNNTDAVSVALDSEGFESTVLK